MGILTYMLSELVVPLVFGPFDEFEKILKWLEFSERFHLVVTFLDPALCCDIGNDIV